MGKGRILLGGIQFAGLPEQKPRNIETAIRLIRHAIRNLNVGGIMVNDAPTMRVDAMPYGGTRDSGIGREGPKYAMHEMSEPRLVVFNLER